MDSIQGMGLLRAVLDHECAVDEAQIAALEAQEEAARAREEAKAREDARERRWLACGAPRRVRDTLVRLDETQAVRRIRKWLASRQADESQWALVLSADKGLGKSVAAGLWLRESGARPIRYHDSRVHEDRELPAWWPVSRFARLEGYSGAFDALCSHAGPIVLDDLGSEYLDTKGWLLQSLDALVDARYCEYRPTLITTNLSADAFKRRYSERVIDRLREGGSYYEFRGESMRHG